MQNTHKTFLALGLVGLLAVGLVVFKGKGKKPENSNQTVVPTSAYSTIKNLSIEQLPPLFPADLPMEKNAEVLRSYESKSSDGRSVAYVRQFLSNKSIGENIAIYEEFFKNAGWETELKFKQEMSSGFAVKKGGVVGMVSVFQNSDGQTTKVEINLAQPVK